MLSTREGQGLDTCIQALKHFNTPLLEELLLVQTTNPHEALFPATKMLPELRHIWKVLENPTGRRLGQESSFSLAIQESLHKMFALQDSPVQEPNSQDWRIMVDKGVLWGTEPMENVWGLLLTTCQPESSCRPCQSRSLRKMGLTPGGLRERI